MSDYIGDTQFIDDLIDLPGEVNFEPSPADLQELAKWEEENEIRMK
jgi:hypothetical protein